MALVGGDTADMGWDNKFTSVQFDTLKSIILRLKDKYDIEKIIGHREVEATKECPSFDVSQWLIDNGLV